MLPIGITPILTPGAQVRLAQSAPPGPAAGKLAAQGRPSVSDFGSGCDARSHVVSGCVKEVRPMPDT